MEKFNILVTGGAGFIGSHLVDALVAAGHRVRILDSLAPEVHLGRVPEHLNPSAEFIHGDVSDPVTTSRALDAIDIVYHLATEVGPGRSMYQIVRFVQGTTSARPYRSSASVSKRRTIRVAQRRPSLPGAGS